MNNALLVVRNLMQHFNQADQSDIAVVVNGRRRYFLHKILLARSEVFRTMMVGSLWADAWQQEIKLTESTDCEPHMEAFFRYFYTAQVNLTRDNLVPLLVLANKYFVRDLEEACERRATKLVFSGTPVGQVTEWWHLAAQLSLTTLQRKCRDYLLLNMDGLLGSPHFLDLSAESLEGLLKARDMVVRSEYTLYKAVVRWVTHAPRRDALSENLRRLLPHLSLSMMSVAELLEIEQSLETQPELGKLIPRYLYEAFKYHAIPFHQRGSAGLAHLDKPRLYTSARLPKVGAMLRLHPHERPQLAAGVTHQVHIPLSLSNADRADTRKWNLVFSEIRDCLKLEIRSPLFSSEQFELVEASVLFYKQINDITFVKGVMQFRCSLANLSDVESGHMFDVHLPQDALDPASPYLISDEVGDFCQFSVVWRHYHGDMFSQGPGEEVSGTPESTNATPGHAHTSDVQPENLSPS